MDTITINIDYQGEITLANQYTTQAPLVLSWFVGNDLVIEANGKKITLNCDKVIAGSVYKLPHNVFV